MKALKIVAGVTALLAVLGFAGYHAHLYSLGLYATAPVYQTSAGAIDGYDPVAYFTEGQAVAGKPEFAHAWNGATWHFASADHLAAFQQDPARYAPQFGGYCAYAVAHAYTAKSDPQAWHVEDGKLYLNFNAEVREAWLQQKAGFIASAAQNWPAVIQD
jgi:YHS domain-containing protein